MGAGSPTSTAPRRVLITADPVGGVWGYTCELARALSAQGVEIAVATMGKALTADQRQEMRAIPDLTLHESSYRLEWMENPWEDVEQSGQWLLRLADQFRPDLVHLNGYVHALLPWPCPCLIVAHSCVVSWWRAVRKDRLPDSFSRYRERVGQAVATAPLLAAPSGAMLASIKENYLAPQQGRVIHNARSSNLFGPGKKAEFVLSVGRLWDDGKNISALTKAASSLSWPVCIAGEPQHPDGIRPPIDHVNHLGQLTPQRLASWFATASIYAHPARYEPFGLTVLEAAMSRCALVLGDIPSLRELWEDAAIFVPPDDNTALVRALRKLCSDRSYRECLAERAVKRSRHFTVEKMAAGYMDAYATLMSGTSTA